MEMTSLEIFIEGAKMVAKFLLFFTFIMIVDYVIMVPI